MQISSSAIIYLVLHLSSCFDTYTYTIVSLAIAMQMRRCDRGTILSRDNIIENYIRADKRYQRSDREREIRLLQEDLVLSADARNLAFCFPIDIIRNPDVSLNYVQRATLIRNLDNKLYNRVGGGIFGFTTYPRSIDALQLLLSRFLFPYSFSLFSFFFPALYSLELLILENVKIRDRISFYKRRFLSKTKISKVNLLSLQHSWSSLMEETFPGNR